MLARRMFVISVMSLTQDLTSARFRHQCLVNRSVIATSPISCLSASSNLSSWHRELPTHYSIRLFCIHTRCHSLLTHFSVQLFCIHTRCHLTSTHISILVVQHHCIHGPLMPLSINTSLIQLFSIRTKMPPLTNTIQFGYVEHHNKTIRNCFKICIAGFSDSSYHSFKTSQTQGSTLSLRGVLEIYWPMRPKPNVGPNTCRISKTNVLVENKQT